MSTHSIAIFIRTLRSGGGAQRAMVRFATGLHRRGYAVTVLTLLPGDAFTAELDPAIPVVRVGGGRLLRAVSGLATWLRRNSVDTLFTAEPACNIVAALAVDCPARVYVSCCVKDCSPAWPARTVPMPRPGSPIVWLLSPIRARMPSSPLQRIWPRICESRQACTGAYHHNRRQSGGYAAFASCRRGNHLMHGYRIVGPPSF